MGTRGSDIFQDDDAMDWLATFEAGPAAAVVSALAAVETEAPGAFLDRGVAVPALAAGEALATALGRPAAGLGDDVRATLEAAAAAVARAEVDPHRAAQVVARAGGEDSEKGNPTNWFRPDDHAAFRATVADLHQRLATGEAIT
ncbi:MAG: DUF4259 domain-containing protein [Pseudomonadota bacterium]